MDEDEDDFPQCPLCLEDLDTTDRAVEACHCGYQVCLWCLHTIREQLNGKCPACRTPYEEQNFRYAQVDPEEAAKEAKERATAKKERERREKIREIERERARSAAVSQQKAKSNLKHARILQKNLVYVIGLSLTLAREEVIRRADMFGKFGRMIRILINRSHPFNADAPGGPSISAYVQYARDSDASAAVRSMNNAVFDGREIRCALATTKYCDSFVRSAAATSDPTITLFCGNNNCLYYHTLCQEGTLTREEVLARQLGPPPPAHLFLPADTRRYPIPYQSRPQPPPLGASPPTPQKLPHSRPLPIHPPTADSLHAKHDMSRIPPQPPISSNIASSYPPRHSSNPPSFNQIQSPMPSPHRSRPYIHPAVVPSSSPHRTPPASPPANYFHNSESVRSPQPRPSRNPYHAYPVHAASAPGSIFDARSQQPLRSRAVASNRDTDRPSLNPPRDIASRKHDKSRVRERNEKVMNRRNAPPGFEDLMDSKTKNLRSGPPGFDLSMAISRNAPTPMEKSTDLREHSKPVMPVKPPPGFRSGTSVQRDNVKDPNTDFATAWSQEASSDEVFSAQSNRGRNRKTVGRLASRLTKDDSSGRPDLADVLAEIGGNLGVSTEFQALGSMSSPFSSAHPRATNPPYPNGSRRTITRVSEGSSALESLFGHDSSQNAVHSMESPSEVGHSAKLNVSSRLKGPANGAEATNGVLFRKTQTISASGAGHDTTHSNRRSRSRFVFARDDPVISTNIPASSIPCGIHSHSLPVSNSAETRPESVSHTPTNMNFPSQPSPPSAFFRPPNVAAPARVDHVAPAPTRYPRSRFDFADHNGPPGINASPPYSHRGAPPSSYSRNPYNRGKGKLGAESNAPAPFSSLTTEEKLASLFNSAQRSDQPLPPMPSVEIQPERVGDIEEKRGVNRKPSGVSNVDKFIQFREQRKGVETKAVISRAVETITPPISGQSASVPPGFLPPSNSVKDRSSVSTSEDSKVLKGKAEDVQATGTREDVNNEVVEPRSETITEESRKTRTQKKKEKKVRQPKEQTERKTQEAIESIKQPSPMPQAEPEVSESQRRSSRTTALRVSSPKASTPPANPPQCTPLNIVATSPGKTRASSKSIQGKDSIDAGIQDGSNAVSVSGNEAVTIAATPVAVVSEKLVAVVGSSESVPEPSISNSNFVAEGGHQHHTEEKSFVVDSRSGNGPLPPGRSNENAKDEQNLMSVSELEKEVEAARAREAQLQDKLLELQRRIRSYDNVQS